jgi:hypothetical protein
MAAVLAAQLKALDEYDGTSDIDLYYEHAEGLQVQFGWDNEAFALAVKQRLKGAALAFISSEKKVNRVYTRWLPVAAAAGNPAYLGLRDALRAWFKEPITNVAAVNAVIALKQRETESVQSFYCRVVEAVDLKNSGWTPAEKRTPEYQAHFQRDIFLFLAAGLSTYLRSRTLGAAVPPVDADALLRSARSIEAELLRGKKTSSNVASVAETAEGVEQHAHDAGEDEGALTRQVAALQLEVQAMRKEAHKNVVCFNCQGRGHLAEHCSSEKTTRPPQQPFRGGNKPRYQGNNRRNGARGRGSYKRGNYQPQRGGFQQRYGNRGLHVHQVDARQQQYEYDGSEN